MERHFVDVQLQEYYLGFVYIASGMKQAHLESRKSSMANGRREA
jgi:hypothetical protein